MMESADLVPRHPITQIVQKPFFVLLSSCNPRDRDLTLFSIHHRYRDQCSASGDLAVAF